MTSLVPDSDRQTSKITAEATKVKKASADTAVRAPRVQSDRDTTRSVFIGER